MIQAFKSYLENAIEFSPQLFPLSSCINTPICSLVEDKEARFPCQERLLVLEILLIK